MGLEDHTEIPGGAVRIKLMAGQRCSLCTCGHSKKVPYCDNTHRNVNERDGTNYKSLKITAEKNCVLYLSSGTWKPNV